MTDVMVDDPRGRTMIRHPALPTLSAGMRAVLIAHLDGPQPIVIGSRSRGAVLALVRRHLLTPDGYKTPKQTFLTDKGRDVACACAEFEATLMLELEALR